MTARRASPALVGVVLLGACGGDEDAGKRPSDAQQVRAAVQAYDRALRDGDAREACELTYLDVGPGENGDRALSESEVASCAKDTRKELRNRPTSGYEVRALKIRGDTATVTIAAPSEAYEEPPRSRLRLRRFGSEWKIAFEPA